MRAAWLVAAASFMAIVTLGCDPDPIEVDAGAAVDAGPMISAECAMNPRGDGCPCGDEGYTECASPTRQCCDGRWITYFDGACWEFRDSGVQRDGSVPTDAGPMDCDPPYPGCPCSGSSSLCRYNRWTLVCVDGIYAEDRRHSCCTF